MIRKEGSLAETSVNSFRHTHRVHDFEAPKTLA